MRTIFIDHAGYFDRDYLYGAGGHDYADNPERFAFLCQAALELGGSIERAATTSSTRTTGRPGWFRCCCGTMRSRTPRARGPTVFTIHNLAYQGVFDASWLPRLGLGWDLMRVDALEYWGRISF